VLVALLIVPFSLARALFTGWIPLYFINIANGLSVILASFFLSRMSLRLKSNYLLVSLWAAGVPGLLTLGMSAPSIWWLVLSCIIASSLYSVRVALALTLLTLLTIALTGLAFIKHWLTPGIDLQAYQLQPLAWIILMIMIGSFILIDLLAISSYNRAFAHVLEVRMQELVQARQLADSANQSKSDFLANMSHEIRTPMNAVLGIAHLLGNSTLDASQRKYVSMISDSGHSLLSILNDILDFSKIEAGRMELAPTAFRLSDMVQALSGILRTSASNKDLNLVFEIAPGVPAVLYGDALRLQQILVNLLGNAIKFTQHGQVKLNVMLLEQQGETVKLKITVEDSGIGMSAEQLGRLFVAFSQADASTTRRFGGSGLGLTICKRLVELMQGSISVRSQVGIGSEFCVTLPLETGSESALAHDSGRAHKQRIDGIRLLLVEDNQVNQIVARGMLEQAGATVEVVEDGLQCVNHLRNYPQRYDLVLMDIQMPVMDGFAATRAIRDELQLSLPVLAMTAGVMESERERCLESGMNDFIAKPINIELMFSTLLRYLPALPGASQPDNAPAPVTATSTDDVTNARPGADTPAQISPTSEHTHDGDSVIFDPSELMAMASGSPEHQAILLGVIKKMTITAPQQMQQAQEHWQQGRGQDAARLLHTMRGSIGSLGAQRFANIAKELELAIRATPPLPPELIGSLFESTHNQLQATVSQAQTWLEQAP
ncbi:MAG: hypothetical protein RL748_2265, partial [Pseudomonadota bacterium]